MVFVTRLLSVEEEHSTCAGSTSTTKTESAHPTLHQQRPPRRRPLPWPSMYEQWPTLEFPDLGQSILHLFSSDTSASVCYQLLGELARDESVDSPAAIRLQSEEHLRWTMQVLNHALGLSFSSRREYETVRAAVRIYVHWLRALTDVPDASIPAALLDTPEKYFRTIIESLRRVFCKRYELGGEVPRNLALERQGHEVDVVLDAVKSLTASASRKYQNEVWTRSLSFLLNSADLLLSGTDSNEDVSMRMGGQVVDTLFDMWLKAVVREAIPSLTYWRTLSVFCRRWRHHVTLIESWARKLLALTVLVSKRMYGEDYSRIQINDESVAELGTVSIHEEEGEPDLLLSTWLNMFSLLASPAEILAHDAHNNEPIHGGIPRDESSCGPGGNNGQQNGHLSTAMSSLPLCFFLAVTSIQRMVDVFYGDSRVSIEFKESDNLMRKWTMNNQNSATLTADDGRRKTDPLRSVTESRESEATVTDRTSYASSTTSTRENGRAISDQKRSQPSRISDRSGKNESASSGVHSQTQSQPPAVTSRTEAGSVSQHAASLPIPHGQPYSRTGESVSRIVADNRQNVAESRPSAANFVAHALSANAVYPFFVGEKGPKSERLLDLTMCFLLDAALARIDKPKGDVNDDVISSLSLHSVDVEDVPEAMTSPDGRLPSGQQRKRTSLGSCSSSVTGDASSVSGDVSVFDHVPAVDGVSAGRAAALATLTRIICSKSSKETIPNEQLASFLAAMHHALIEKDRVVLCALFYHGQALFRLGLPGLEALLPHFLFALDIVLIESSQLRLHPSIAKGEMRRACLRCLSSVICWPTTFGMATIPQLSDASNLKSSAATYLHLRSRIYKTLIFSLRNETEPSNLHLALAMCTVVLEESCSFDLGLSEQQTRELVRITTQGSTTSPEKGLCVSLVRGVVSAVCDRLCRPEWAGEHSVALAAVDVLNALATLNPAVLFSNKDVSTGSLIVASLCRFIETQLSKPPPQHSKDLHSTVVAAYNSIAVWLASAPMLAECEGVLNTVAEAVQLGVTGAKRHQAGQLGETKAASKRVLEAAEYLMYSLFSVVGRSVRLAASDERRLLHEFGPMAIDTTKFMHFIVNGDTLLSLHEASHISQVSNGCPCLLYVRRSPLQAASVGVARLRPNPIPGTEAPPPTPMSAAGFSDIYKKESMASQQSHQSRQSALSSVSDASAPSRSSACLTPSTISGMSGTPSQWSSDATSITPSVTSSMASASPSIPSGSILTGVSEASLQSATAETLAATVPSTPVPPAIEKPTVSPPSVAQSFVIPPEFTKVSCKLDTTINALESTPETEAVIGELRRAGARADQPRAGNVWDKLPLHERILSPAMPLKTCSSIRVFLYDMGLVERDTFGTTLFQLDSGQSADFYRDLHDMVDSCPAKTIQTAHIFYVKDGQRSAIDILDNALNIQNTCADFCGFLAGLGEGVEVGVHDSWTGHWSTAYSSERKPVEETEGVDHYLLDGVSHALWFADASSEIAFLMPTERSLRMFKQDLAPPSVSSRRGSSYKQPSSSSVSDDVRSDHSSAFEGDLLRPVAPYGGGGSSMGNSPPSRRSGELRVMIVWLERAEDTNHYPVEELLCACDDGSDRASRDRVGHLVLFIHMIEQGLVTVRSRGSPNRFGEAGPLLDGMVISLASLPAFVRLTLLNINRRNVAEIENYQFMHTKRKQAIVEFGKKYAANLTYEDFVAKLLHRSN